MDTAANVSTTILTNFATAITLAAASWTAVRVSIARAAVIASWVARLVSRQVVDANQSRAVVAAVRAIIRRRRGDAPGRPGPTDAIVAIAVIGAEDVSAVSVVIVASSGAKEAIEAIAIVGTEVIVVVEIEGRRK